MDEFCLIFFAVFFAFSFSVLFKNDKFYGIFYAALFLFSYPCLLVYKYFPFAIFDYYAGGDYFFPFLFFLLGSFFCLFCSLKHFSYNVKESPIQVFENDGKGKYYNLVVILLFVFILSATFLLLQNLSSLSYHSRVLNYEYQNRSITLLVYMFEISKLLIIVFASIRNKSRFIRCLFWYSLALFLFYSFKSGDRSGIVAIAAGLFIIYFNNKDIKFKHILLLILGGYLLLLFMESILIARGSSDGAEKTFIETLLIGDQTFPALYIPQMIKLDYIDPFELIVSNILSSIVGINHSYMYMIAGEKFMTGLSVSEGIGFHLFTEGYIFAGFGGIFWNGIVIGWLLSLWRRFANTNNESFNTAILAVMSSYIIQIARSTGSFAFFKEFYLFVIPSLIIYCLLTNCKIYKRNK